ncbi:para-nitrobenzyl esterase isoform 2-T3 [Spinachia spinachia]
MKSCHCLLLLCMLSLALASREATEHDDDINFVGFLRSILPGVLVRDKPFSINKDFGINSVRELGRRAAGLISEQSKVKSVNWEPNGAPGPVVVTKDGQIKGVTVDKAHIFYGIPYADPPVGAYRWKPPRPASPWPGVYDASFPRASCMQACSGPMTEECPRTVSEDCLYLNVFVPLDVDFSCPLVAPLPVMVWIHGGDFIAGSASKSLYDGRFISNTTKSVVVSLEYRLGAFGFLVSGKDAHSAVGNYGILDQQAALLWVQRSIAVFGGDPSKVTIFGESAGAQSVSLHLIIQSSKPLFKQAVLQSLPFSIPLKSRHDALKLGKDFAKQTKCSVGDIVCLLSLAPQAVLAAQMKTSSKVVNPFRFLEVFETWGPFIDGKFIKEQAVTAFQKGHWQKEKPLLLGTTSEEGVIFAYGVFNKPVSVLESTVSSARAGTATGSEVWMYMFDHVASDPRVWSGLTFCYEHACHGAELPFLFGSASVANFTLSLSEKLLSNRMLCYWGAFAHTGDPSSRAQQTSFCHQQRLPVWPRYSDTSSWLVMNLTVRSHAQVGTRDHICDFWDHLGIYY